MKFYIRNSLKVVCIGTAMLGIIFMSYSIHHGIQYWKDSKENLNSIESVVGSFQPSSGNLYGNIYSLDGKPMLKCLDLNTGEDITGKRTQQTKGILYCATESFFAPMIGYEYFGESFSDSGCAGMLAESEIKRILQANSLYSNERAVRGDSIITTIVSSAQKEAVEQLNSYSDATLAVVNADGAVLVNASSVDQQQEFQNSYIRNDTELPLYYISNYNAHESLAVGSSFKTISARVFEQNNEKFSQEWSVYNNAFDDISTVNIDGVVVSNWEINSNFNPANYYTYCKNEIYHRNSSLADALINSSNTYFLRHADAMGLMKYQEMLDATFQLYHQYDIGGCTLLGLQLDESNEYSKFLLPFGQAAVISPVRLASAYNHALGGKFYLPFEITQIRTPDDEVIFQYQPEEISEYSLKISINNDILVDGLEKTFLSYVRQKDGTYYPMLDDFPASFLGSGRLLAKSGTAVIDDDFDNRTMALTLLDENQDAVICTAVIAVKHVKGNTITNTELIFKLLKVMEKMGVLE